MSKRSLFWGQASGKLGEAVYYRAGGEQRTRAWVAKVKNPKSQAQALQRCLLNGLTAAYKSAPTFFQQVMRPEKSSMTAFNQFVKINSKVNQFVANKDMIQNQQGFLYGLQLASGDSSYPSGYYNPAGEQTIDLQALKWGNSKGESTLDDPYMWTQTNPCEKITLENTRAADLTSMPRGLIYGKELYQIFKSAGNPYGLPNEFAFFIIAQRYAGDEIQTIVLGCKCNADSNDKIHTVSVSKNPEQMPPVEGNWNFAVIPTNGTTTVPTIDKDGSIEGATSFVVDTSAFDVDNEYVSIGVCVAYRDTSGLHSSPCSLYVTRQLLAEYVTEIAPYKYDGIIGQEIISEYTIASSQLV